VYPEVIHALQICVRPLEVNQIQLKWIETLGDFCNVVWIGQGEPGEVIGWHDLTFLVLNDEIVLE
jgi:hypothetical protein